MLLNARRCPWGCGSAAGSVHGRCTLPFELWRARTCPHCVVTVCAGSPTAPMGLSRLAPPSLCEPWWCRRTVARCELVRVSSAGRGHDEGEEAGIANWLWFVVLIVAILVFVVAVEAWGARHEHSVLAHFICLTVGILAVAWSGDLAELLATGVFGS